MNERAIFDTALDLEDEQQRSAYLDEACSGDSQLRQHIDRLLDACPRLGSFLEHPPRPELPAGPLERPGELIGNYQLLEQIGEGGFGVVYLAEQQQPVRRLVAVKIIKPGMDSRAVIARFEAERQALAMMDHPHIARVLDAGTTQSGRPYFVMELVRGAAITDYCDRNRLTLVERLRLFVPVCRAIQHAHQKGVIHRDIKPSNVLVTLCDGKPVPKVIDFGVAKAISHRLTEETLCTLHGQVIGTLEYMSPEQAETGSLDIDTRSDVYSLGVLLYELLTGSTPLPRARFAKATWDQALRLIREHEPATPSQRLGQAGDALPNISAQRRTEPRRLAALVRGDLDWVVMKSLEKSRHRRYATALDLAADVERYLSHEPVTACPPSWVYRCRKLALKHARLVLPLGALLLVLLVAGPVSVWQAIRATRAEVAVRGQRDAARRATDDADLARRELWAAYRQLAAEQQRTTRLRDVAVRNEARLAAEKGENFVQRGELREGLLWLATSLSKLPDQETALKWAIESNLAAVLGDMPRPLLPSPLKTGEGAHLDFVVEAGLPDQALLVTVAGQPPSSQVASWIAGDTRFSKQALDDPATPRLESLYFGATATRFVGLAPGAEIVFGDLNLPASRYQRYPWGGSGYSQLFVNAKRDRLLAICWDPQRVELFDLHAGQRIGEPLAPEAGQFLPVGSGDGPFSSDGSSFALLRQVPELTGDGQPATGLLLHRWRADDGQPLSPATRLSAGDGGQPEHRHRCGPRAATLVRYVRDVTSRAPRWQLASAATGDAIGAPFGDATGATAMALSPDGLLLAAAAGQPGLQCTTIRLWNLARPGDLLGTFSVPAAVNALRFGPDGRTLFVAGRSPAAIWSVPAPRATRQILPHTSPLESVEVSRDGQTVLTITGRQAARWSATTGELLGPPLPLPHSDSAASLPAAFRPDGQRLVLAEGADIHRLDADSGLPAGQPIRAPHHVVTVAYSADGQRIFCVCCVDQTKGEILVYDDQTGRPVGSPVALLAVFSPDKQALRRGGAAISPDGKTVLVTDRLDRLRIWPADGQGEPRGAIPTRGELSDVRFTPDGNRVLTVTGQHLIEFWDAPTGARVGRPVLLDLPARAVAISRDGRLLATAHGETVTCRFVETGGTLGRPWPVADVTSLCFSDDGQTLYAGLATGLARAFRVSHSIPAEALVLDHAETTTGGRLTDDGILEDLPAAAWRERLVRSQRCGPPEAGEVPVLPRLIDAGLTARTAAQWQYLLPQIEASADAGDDWLMRLMLARGHHELGQPQQALGALRRALQQGGPEPLRAWLKSFAGDAAARRRLPTAQWYLEACVALGLADAETQLMLAELHTDQERGAEATAALQQATSLAPDAQHVRRRAAGLYGRLAQWDAASAELTRALELTGGNSDLWRARARCFAELSQWEQAADDLSRAVQREPNNADLREWLGIALVSAHDLPAYRALCADTLRRFDLSDYSRRPWIAPKLLVLAPDGLSDYEPILGPAQDFEARYPSNCVTYHVLGPYQYRAGLWAEAARQSPPEDSSQAVMVDELLFVAMAHLRLGNTGDARRILEQVEHSRWQTFDVWSRQRVQLLLDEARGLLPD